MADLQKNKNVKISIYKIDKTSTDLSQVLDVFNAVQKSALQKSKASQRLMKLSEAAEDQDLLSSYTINPSNKYIFGTMMRLIPESRSGKLPDNLLNQEQISLEEIRHDSNASLSKTLTEYFYFALNNQYILVNSNKSIGAFQTYINWFTESYRGKSVISFLPKMELPTEIAWKDLKTIEFGENSKIMAPINSGIITKTTKLTKEILQSVIGKEATESLNDTDLEQIVSAKLIISIKRKTKENTKSYEKVASILAKPLDNQDYLTLTAKDGSKLKGSEICAFRKIAIPVVSTGNLNEATLRLEMEKILSSLENQNE